MTSAYLEQGVYRAELCWKGGILYRKRKKMIVGIEDILAARAR